MEYGKFIENINWPEKITEEQKKFFIEHIKWKLEEKSRLCVVYHPNCGCKIDQFAVLDRYPMSPKIMSMCPICDKGVLFEISDPIVFHLPVTNQDFKLEDLKNYDVTNTPQKLFIEMYQLESKISDSIESI